MMYLDLEEIDHVFNKRWFWSSKRPAFARFKRENYLGDPRQPLKESVKDLVEKSTGKRPDGPIRLLTHLSYFGYCFNPITIYYCFDSKGERIDSIVAEVSNTPWGERHTYVLTCDQNTGDEQSLRFRTSKQLHVSPFMDMDMEYNWLLTRPADDLVLRIDNEVSSQQLFRALLLLKRQEISGPALARVLVIYPFITFRIILGIHWQAFKLWLKKCPLYAHPKKRSSIEAYR